MDEEITEGHSQMSHKHHRTLSKLLEGYFLMHGDEMMDTV